MVMKSLKLERRVCSYCQKTVPLAKTRHRIVNTPEGGKYLCYDDDNGGCHREWLLLQKTKGELMEILPLVKEICGKDLACIEEVKIFFRLNQAREFVVNLIRALKRLGNQLKKAAINTLNELCAKLTYLAEILHLREEVAFIV